MHDHEIVFLSSHKLIFQGLPYPASEQKAVDAVIKYAVTKLGFRLEEIILFAWSIGK